MTPRMTQDEALVRAELRALVEEYAFITDAFDYDAWVALFLPDGEFTARNAAEDEPFVTWKGEALKDVLHNNDQWERTFHFIGNHRVTFDGPRPKGVTYCLAHHKYAEGDPRQSYIMLMRYFDEYELTDEGWRFAHRHAEMVWQEIHDVDNTLMAVADSGMVEL